MAANPLKILASGAPRTAHRTAVKKWSAALLRKARIVLLSDAFSSWSPFLVNHVPFCVELTQLCFTVAHPEIFYVEGRIQFYLS